MFEAPKAEQNKATRSIILSSLVFLTFYVVHFINFCTKNHSNLWIYPSNGKWHDLLFSCWKEGKFQVKLVFTYGGHARDGRPFRSHLISSVRVETFAAWLVCRPWIGFSNVMTSARWIGLSNVLANTRWAKFISLFKKCNTDGLKWVKYEWGLRWLGTLFQSVISLNFIAKFLLPCQSRLLHTELTLYTTVRT